MIKKIFISPILLIFIYPLCAVDFSGFSNPESVYVNKNIVFVSNIGEKPLSLAKDGDGFISKLDSNGNIIEKEFISNLNAPKGMAIIDNILYVADIDTIKGFDLNNKKEVFNLAIKDSKFLNDIEMLDNKTLLASDTATGIIYIIDLSGKYDIFVKIDSKFGGPNGLLLDKNNNCLIVAGYDPTGKVKGSIVSVDLDSKEQIPLSKPLGSLDGIAFAKNGDLLVSDWGDKMQGVIYRINQNNDIKILKLESIKGPADIFSDGENLWIPKMLESKVSKINLP